MTHCCADEVISLLSSSSSPSLLPFFPSCIVLTFLKNLLKHLSIVQAPKHSNLSYSFANKPLSSPSPPSPSASSPSLSTPSTPLSPPPDPATSTIPMPRNNKAKHRRRQESLQRNTPQSVNGMPSHREATLQGSADQNQTWSGPNAHLYTWRRANLSTNRDDKKSQEKSSSPKEARAEARGHVLGNEACQLHEEAEVQVRAAAPVPPPHGNARNGQIPSWKRRNQPQKSKRKSSLAKDAKSVKQGRGQSCEDCLSMNWHLEPWARWNLSKQANKKRWHTKVGFASLTVWCLADVAD